MAKKKAMPAKSRRSSANISGDIEPTPDLIDTSDIGHTGDIDDTPDIPDTRDFAAARASSSTRLFTFTGTSGDDIVELARDHIGEKYALGARAPMGNPNWRGPWDCAEFVSWCVFRASGVLYGTEPHDDPMLADAYTGFWAQQAQAGRHMISVSEAAGIAGAAVLRMPRTGAIGHIVISDGKGGTVEAHSSLRGVIANTLSGRRWDAGILVPGIRYLRADAPVTVEPARPVLRLTTPLTRGDAVRALQQQLTALGYSVGTTDGIFGPQTAHAVRAFQGNQGLVADGEAGPATLKALRLL